MFSPKKKRKVNKNVFINSIERLFSQYIRISNHHIVHFKILDTFANYTSIRLKEKDIARNLPQKNSSGMLQLMLSLLWTGVLEYQLS